MISNPLFHAARTRLLTACGMILVSTVGAIGRTPAPLPESGKLVPGLESMDITMRNLVTKWGLSGGSLAVVKDGRLVYARAFGYADPENQDTFLPTTTGRIGSAAKVMTTAEILRLVEKKRFSLDAKVFGAAGILNNLPVPKDADPRVYQITVRNLLNMTTGWDKRTSGDVLVPPLLWDDAQFFGVPLPLTLSQYGASQLLLPLEKEAPGSVYRYLNTSPMHLAMIIERVTGRPYAEVIQSDVLGPIGVKSASVAALRREERRMDEAVYESFGLDTASLYPGEGIVPLQGAFGVLDITGCAPTGGWVCSSTDLARFWACLSGERTPALVKPETYQQMVARPPGVTNWANGSSYWYGFHTENYDNGQTRSKYGSLPGTAAWVAQKANGYIVAVIFNARDSRVGEPSGFHDIGGNLFDVDVRASLDKGLKQITSVPKSDLFNTEYAADRPAFSNPRLAGGVVGSPFSFRLSTFFTGTTFSTGALPPGLSYNPDRRRIEGTPTKAGHYAPTIIATAGAASTRNRLAIEIVNPASPIFSGSGYCHLTQQNVIEMGRQVDEVVMTGAEVVVQANPDRGTRVRFIDENDDLVEAELSGPGLLGIKLAGSGATVRQRPAKYNLTTLFVKGRPTFRIAGATPETVFRYYALGRVNFDAGALMDQADYNGVADAASLTIAGTGMKEICLNNARFVGSSSVVGIDAPGVVIGQELSLADLVASKTAQPRLIFGKVSVISITGRRDLSQPNGAAIDEKGIGRIEPASAGLTAEGLVVTPPPIQARFVKNGVDVTSKIVRQPAAEPDPVDLED